MKVKQTGVIACATIAGYGSEKTKYVVPAVTKT